MDLGVNIDHIATLREARKTRYPDPVQGAVLAELAGAHQITCHLREDRRHVNERDLRLLKETVQTRLNLELALVPEIIEMALNVKPHRVTFVPERREEVTTEGGLNLLLDEERIRQTIDNFHKAGVETALFIDPSEKQIESARRVRADAVELHTGSYANSFDDNMPIWKEHLQSLRDAAIHAKSHNLEVYAGHGLNVRNVAHIVAIPEITELNIGHALIARACMIGMTEAVRELLHLMKRNTPHIPIETRP